MASDRVAGFVEYLMAGRSDLVAPDDHRARMPRSDRLGFGDSEAQSPL